MYDKELVAHKLLRWEKAVSGFKLPSWENIPDIGLYMDQVIVLLSQYLGLITSAGDKEEDEDEQGDEKTLKEELEAFVIQEYLAKELFTLV